MPVALITGGSRGLGRALTYELSRREWTVVIDGRDAQDLRTAAAGAPGPGGVLAVPGDVSDGDHRRELGEAIRRLGGLDLLVNNASVLGPSPQPRLRHYPVEELELVYRVNVLGPVALTQAVFDDFRPGSVVVNVTSDAAVEAYEGWGGYGSSKAALDHISAILGAEEDGLSVYAFDPGDMRTQMQQEAFPGEDISDRAEPESVVPALLHLLDARPPGGRYRATDLFAAAPGVS